MSLDDANENGTSLHELIRDPAVDIEEELKQQSQLLTARIARLPPKLRAVIEEYRMSAPTMDELPYAVVLAIAVYSGLNAALWIIVLSRLSMLFLAGLTALQLFNSEINTSLANWLVRTFDLKPALSETGIHRVLLLMPHQHGRGAGRKNTKTCHI